MIETPCAYKMVLRRPFDSASPLKTEPEMPAQMKKTLPNANICD